MAPPVSDDTFTLLQLLSRTYHELMPIFERYMGMTRARWGILSKLRKNDIVRQSDLQSMLQVDGAAITRQVKHMEAEGLIVRRVDPKDNRFTLISLTEKGSQLVACLQSTRDSFESLVTAGLDDAEIAMLRSYLSLLRANLREVNNKLDSKEEG